MNPGISDFFPFKGIRKYKKRNFPTQKNLDEYNFTQSTFVIANTLGIYAVNIAYVGLAIYRIYRGIENIVN